MFQLLTPMLRANIIWEVKYGWGTGLGEALGFGFRDREPSLTQLHFLPIGSQHFANLEGLVMVSKSLNLKRRRQALD